MEHPPEQRNYTKQRTIVVFLKENLNYKIYLKVETLFIADINFLFIHFSLFKGGLHAVNNFLTNE